MKNSEQFIQIGIAARRDMLTGGFLPAIPLYVRAEDVGTDAEERFAHEVGRDLARMMKQYKDGCKAAGVKV